MQSLMKALIPFLSLALALAASGRETRPLDAGWKFHQGDADGASGADFDDSAWESVDVPHDWSIAGEFKKDAPTGGAGGWLPSGSSWYRRTFEAPAHDGPAWVEFDGVMANSTVWLNGEKVGEWPYGYSTFRCDLAGKLKEGENVLVVRSDTTAQPASRWYTGAGIYRHVRLVLADAASIVPDGVFVTTPVVNDEEAVVRVQLERRDAAKDLRSRVRVFDPDGKQRFEVWRDGDDFTVKVPEPRLWGVDSPELYRMVVELHDEGEVVDSVPVTFGIRKAEFRADTGFWLNGENLKLKGVCLHHDGGAVGAAVPLDVWKRRFTRLRELGVNAIRSAHNPPDPGFLDLCDRMGFLVMDESFDCWTKGKNPHDYHKFFKDWWERDLRAMVRRDRNHPSVVLYSVGNEIRDTHDEELAKGILDDLVRVCHEEDPSRPVTQALFRPNVTHDYDNGLADKLDVIGTNYRDLELLQAWKDDPSRKIVGTEQGHERSTWFHCRDNPQHAGQFLWCGIDYLGEARSWPVTSFNAGLLDRTGWVQPRGWERMSWWSEKPMVKIFRRLAPTEATPPDPGYEVVEWKRRQVLFPDWTPENDDEQKVEIYSNADEVELFLNGESLGTKKVKKDIQLNWNVPFEKGTLKAVARRGGEEVAVDEVATAGEPAKLAVGSDVGSLTEDFERVAHIEVRVQDAAGNTCPRSSNEVRFEVAGPGELVAVDNGSITSHESFVGDKRSAFQGRCLAIVRATGEGTIVVTASSEGLESAKVEIDAK